MKLPVSECLCELSFSFNIKIGKERQGKGRLEAHSKMFGCLQSYHIEASNASCLDINTSQSPIILIAHVVKNHLGNKHNQVHRQDKSENVLKANKDNIKMLSQRFWFSGLID